MKTAQFIKKLATTQTEEEVKATYIRWLGLDMKTRHRVDCITKHIWWEFKYDVALSKPAVRAKTVAQALYYVKKEIERPTTDVLPSIVVCADKNEACIVYLDTLQSALAATDVNWARQPSSPDPALVERLMPALTDINVYRLVSDVEADTFKERILAIYHNGTTTIRKHITGKNFVDVFHLWKADIGVHFVGYEDRLHAIFAKDLSGDATQVQFHKDTGDLQIIFDDAKPIRTKVPAFMYTKFWSIWQRPPSQIEYERIIRSLDRFKDDKVRKITGSFFTPLSVVDLQMYYMRRELGDNFESKYYIWDPACGTANLEYRFSTYENTFLSTIDDGEIDIIKTHALAVGAEIFKYDFLNDDIDLIEHRVPYSDVRWKKLPEKLRWVLTHQPNKLIILMNPPFGKTAFGRLQSCQLNRLHSANHKTKLFEYVNKRIKHMNNLGKQFIYRGLFHAQTVYSYALLNFFINKGSLQLPQITYRGLFMVPGNMFNVKAPVCFTKLTRSEAL